MKSRIDKLKYRFEIDIYNTKYYYKNNVYHRDKDLPTMIRKDGSRLWFKNGLEHRDNGKPSSIYTNGELYWYYNGKYIKDNLDEIEN